jgi:two-component system cell cycle response regulator DivK
VRAPDMPTRSHDLPPLVLLVDDDADSRALYGEYLTAVAGFRVAEAADGRQGVDMAGALLPAVIVMDLSLPVLDGRGAMRALRDDPRTSAIPIVALTGFAEVRSSKEPGFKAVLVKPCLAGALADAITSVLAGGA